VEKQTVKRVKCSEVNSYFAVWNLKKYISESHSDFLQYIFNRCALKVAPCKLLQLTPLICDCLLLFWIIDLFDMSRSLDFDLYKFNFDNVCLPQKYSTFPRHSVRRESRLFICFSTQVLYWIINSHGLFIICVKAIRQLKSA